MRLRESFDKREEKMKNFSLFLAVTFQSRRNIPGNYPLCPRPLPVENVCTDVSAFDFGSGIWDLGSGIWDRSHTDSSFLCHLRAVSLLG